MREEKTLYLNNWEFNIARVLKRLEKVIDDNGGEFVSNWEKEFDNYKFISRNTNQELKAHFKNRMTFVLDGFLYYFQIDENPFFEFYIIKNPIENYISKNRYYKEELNKNWFYDCLFNSDCNDEEIKEIANLFFNELVIKKPCRMVRGKDSLKPSYQHKYNVLQ